jgi:hypothetical protein
MKHARAIVGTALSLITFSCGGAGAGPGELGAVAENVSDTAADPARVDEVKAAEPETAVANRPRVSFVAAAGCDDSVAGTWRGQVYSDPHGGYYEFTAKIARPTPGQSGLSGSLVARSWGGAPESVAPPDACDDDSFHWTVLEEAAGEVRDDGSVAFGGTSWSVGEHLCGERVTDYSLDHLALVHADGDDTHLHGTVSDSAVWVGDGLPIELTHIACE